jgi:acid phosphatase family membrane protein YuiD
VLPEVEAVVLKEALEVPEVLLLLRELEVLKVLEVLAGVLIGVVVVLCCCW